MSLKSHYFDKSKIDKVIVNLLSNAIKFTPKGGKITVRVWDEGGILKVSVTDTGIGIPKEKLGQVFERFMQVDASSTRAYGGMGIGLSLVKDFVEQHGGTVEVESEVGNGTRFTITLPRGKEHFKATVVEASDSDVGKGVDLPIAPIAETMGKGPKSWDTVQESPGPETPDSGLETVLVVDDTPDMLQAVGEVLKGRYRMLFANDGEEGVQMAREQRPDLVISDVMMPKKDGYGLLKDLKGDPVTREIPIILLTAKSGEENLAIGFQYGADDYVTKPFQPKEVLSRTANLIRIRRQREEIARQRDELARMNRELKEMEAELVQSEKLSTVGMLAAGIAHEINNPAYALTLSLANIEVRLEEMQNGNRGETLEKLQHHLKRSQEEIGRIKKIVKTILGYSQKNREGVKRGDLADDIENTLVLLKHQIEESKATVHWERKSLPIEADHGALNQAVTNVIQNALQAGAKNIRIAADRERDNCRIRIADDGSGIPEEVLPRIFEPFFTTKEVGKGSGLGLNIVHRIIKAHHGEVLVTSKVGSGSEFTIVLPVNRSHRS